MSKRTVIASGEQACARFGLSPVEVVELRERRRFYYQWLSVAYQTKADVGDYRR